MRKITQEELDNKLQNKKEHPWEGYLDFSNCDLTEVSFNKAREEEISLDKSNFDNAFSILNEEFIYEKGKTVKIENFDLRYNIECASGIHFFKTREEAVNYTY